MSAMSCRPEYACSCCCPVRHTYTRCAHNAARRPPPPPTVGNAVKFTSAGSVDVQLIIEDGSVVIAVADTGRGMSEENLATLFQPFTQVGGWFTPERKVRLCCKRPLAPAVCCAGDPGFAIIHV